MGTSIHTYIEVRRGDRWEPFISTSRRGVKRLEEEIAFYGGTSSPPFPSCRWFHPEKDYQVFAFLAGVRYYHNGLYYTDVHPLTKKKLGGAVPSYFMPKGMPKDASTYVQAGYNEFGSDAHSASYLTLKELLGYNWNFHCGDKLEILSLRDFDEFRHNRPYKTVSISTELIDGKLCEAINKNPNFIIIDVETAVSILNGEYSVEDESLYYIPIVRTETLRELLPNLASDISELSELTSSEGIPPEHVRVVFWFDN